MKFVIAAFLGYVSAQSNTEGETDFARPDWQDTDAKYDEFKSCAPET